MIDLTKLQFKKGKNKYFYLIALTSSIIFACNTVFATSIPHFIEETQSAESFVDSIGVVAHLGFEGTSYDRYDGVIKPRLQELGIKHIRSRLHKPSNRKPIDRVKDLATIGIKTNVVANPRNMTPKETVEAIKLQLEGVGSVEGPNEWNINPSYKYQGKSFPEGVSNFQKELYSALKRDSQTSHLDVIAPSLAFASLIPNDVKRLGKVPCDINNMHSYPAGRLPTFKPLDSVQIPENKKVCGADKPIFATETGYSNAVNYRGHDNTVSEIAAAKYINRLFLEYFNRGVKRAFTYELINLHSDPSKSQMKHNWGLLRANGSRKKEYFALKHLLAILKEPESSSSIPFESQSLSYSLGGNLNDIHHTLLQKKDGRMYLILWQEVPSYDRERKANLTVPNRGVVFTPTTPVSKVSAYKPYGSPKSFKSWSNPKKVHIGVPDHPVILEITPSRTYAD